MARAFSESARADVRAAILREALTSFARFGYRKTAMDDIARGAGIAKGTLYLFFHSKAALFAAITADAETDIRGQITELTRKRGESSFEFLRRFLRLNYALLRGHPVLWIVTNPVEADAVFRDLSTEVRDELLDSDEQFFKDVLRTWQKGGLIRPIAPRTFAATLRALYVLELRRDIIGEAEYEEVVELMIESLAANLAVNQAAKVRTR